MRKTYKVHLKSGTVVKLKADDFTVKWEGDTLVEWIAPNPDHWVFFLPNEISAVERVR